MGARRSERRRTAIALPRGNRRPHSASTVLLSFALLAALSTPVGSRGLAVRGSGTLGVPKSASGAAAPSAVSASSFANVSGAPSAIVAHRTRLVPPALPTRVRPKRAAATLDQEVVTTSVPFAVITAPPDTGAEAVAADRVEEGAVATFLAFASDSSRTRGQPVVDC